MGGGAGGASACTTMKAVAARPLVRPTQSNRRMPPMGAFGGTINVKLALPVKGAITRLTMAWGAVEPEMRTVQSTISPEPNPESVTTTVSPGSAAGGRMMTVG